MLSLAPIVIRRNQVRMGDGEQRVRDAKIVVFRVTLMDGVAVIRDEQQAVRSVIQVGKRHAR